MNQAVAFGLLLAGGVLLEGALTGKGVAAALQGKAGAVPSKGSQLAISGASGGLVSNVGSTISGAVSKLTGSGAVSPATWARAVLAAGGWPETAQNVTNLTEWARREGGGGLTSGSANDASYNPLNTTESAPGARSVTAVGIKAYPNWQTGVNATVATLKNGSYPRIVAALASGDTSTSAFGALPDMSTWGTGTW